MDRKKTHLYIYKLVWMKAYVEEEIGNRINSV